LNIAKYKQLLFIFFKGRWIDQRVSEEVKTAVQKSIPIGTMIDRNH